MNYATSPSCGADWEKSLPSRQPLVFFCMARPAAVLTVLVVLIGSVGCSNFTARAVPPPPPPQDFGNPQFRVEVQGVTARYGNWCGNNWSGGLEAPALGSGSPVDLLDAACRQHDLGYVEANNRWAPRFAAAQLATADDRHAACSGWVDDYSAADNTLRRMVLGLPVLDDRTADADEWQYNAQAFGPHEWIPADRRVFAFWVAALIPFYKKPPCDGLTASVSVLPENAAIAVGESVQLEAQPRNGDGDLVDWRLVFWVGGFDWTGLIAFVGPSGLVTGVAPGEVTIRAITGGRSGSARITVTAP